MIPHPLQLFSPNWYEPVNVRTQVDRMPGVNAPCLCGKTACAWPFCKPPEVRS
jgi:hypothetical protein